jgi:hypothetical protein
MDGEVVVMGSFQACRRRPGADAVVGAAVPKLGQGLATPSLKIGPRRVLSRK